MSGAKRSYRIDTGDSNTGVAGFVAYIEAQSEFDALETLRTRIDVEGYQVEDDDGFNIRIYLNPKNVTIAEVELEDGESRDQAEAANAKLLDLMRGLVDEIDRCGVKVSPELEAAARASIEGGIA